MKTKKLKTITLWLCFLTGFIAYSQERNPTEISINEAIDKEMLELRISGAYDPRMFEEVIDKDGLHYGKCVSIILKSKIDTFVLLRLDCGTQLIPDDSVVQTMIVTKKAIFPLYPDDIYATRFYAMCGEIHNAPPNIATTFTIGELADEKVVKLARYLDENHIQNMIGQHALWAITDQVDFEALKIYGADSLSIAKTKEILNKLEIETTLTPTFINENSNEITINRYYLYAGCGLIFMLSIVIVVLSVRNKRKNTNITVA